jgi:GGDEF domain-containing protein
MSAAALRIYRQTSLPQRLTALAVLAYVSVFLIFVSASRPGLGIGQGFYIPIILVALGSTTAAGAGAGLAAGALYEIGLILDGGGPASARAGVHLAGYVIAGALVGYFATRARSMLSEALQVLDDLLHLARRDLGTGLLDTDGLDRALAERISARAPFTLVVGEIAAAQDDEAVLRRASQALLQELGPTAEIARIGPAHVAVVTTPRSIAAARALAGSLERTITAAGGRATFGWTVHPTEGTDTWTLFRAASERLDARRIVRGEWMPTAASAGLVDELVNRASVHAE